MKISDALARHKPAAPSVKQRVLEHIRAHPEEVFTYRDGDLLEVVGTNATGLNFALWSLGKDGEIDMFRADGRVYFGTSEAITRLKSRLGGLEWLTRGSENRERIFKRVGLIDTRELLDSVREGRWE